jgi:hypothetical protein
MAEHVIETRPCPECLAPLELDLEAFRKTRHTAALPIGPCDACGCELLYRPSDNRLWWDPTDMVRDDGGLDSG